MPSARTSVQQTISALSDPTRLAILDLLTRGHDASCKSPPHPEFPEALCPYLDLHEKLASIAPSKLSYHLKELRRAGLIEEHPLGKRIYYTRNVVVLKELISDLTRRYL